MTDCFLFLYLFFYIITVSKCNIEVLYLSTFSVPFPFFEKIFAKNSLHEGIDLFVNNYNQTYIF